MKILVYCRDSALSLSRETIKELRNDTYLLVCMLLMNSQKDCFKRDYLVRQSRLIDPGDDVDIIGSYCQ